MKLPSRIMEDAVTEFSRLPGIGKKTALRLVLHLMQEDASRSVRWLSHCNNKTELRYCKRCFNIAEDDLCSICMGRNRQHQMICVVESLRDLLAIENTQQYQGFTIYWAVSSRLLKESGLNNFISLSLLIDFRGWNLLNLFWPESGYRRRYHSLLYTCTDQKAGLDVRITSIARGISFGGELEYTDEITLARSRCPNAVSTKLRQAESGSQYHHS